MGVLQDLDNEIKHYGQNYLQISVENFKEPGSDINVNDECSFQLRLKNTGPLDMQNVVMHMNPKSGSCWLTQSQILGNPINFSTSTHTTPAANINAHTGIWYSQLIYMKARKKTSGVEELFEVHLASWEASLHHMLTDESKHETAAMYFYKNEIKSN